MRKIEQIAGRDAAVVDVGHALTMHLGPGEILLNLGIEFVPGLSAEEIYAAVHRIEAAIIAQDPSVTRIYIEVESFRRGHGRAAAQPPA